LIAEEAATTFQDAVRRAETILHDNPDLIGELGRVHTGGTVSPAQLGEASRQLFEEGKSGFARALEGNAMEALVNGIL
jgi:hypothetical protein